MDITVVKLSDWMSAPTILIANVKFSKFLLVLFSMFWLLPMSGQSLNQPVKDQIVIGDDGIMRWSENGGEVTGFGFNYTVPFAHAFRMGKKLGVDLKKAIDQDVYQFARLGLDLYRVHVWDCEISDTLGNLIDNEHLELLDYLLYRLEQHHINAIITPIAYWGNGWPDRDEPTPGFSSKYGKENCLTDPNAIKAQENYLAQFVNHVNRYTGIPYKSYKSILAFEICNEPHHHGTPDEVTSFVKRMKDAVRSTGCTKPVFYNVSHSINLAESYYAAGIDGGTFQWYPTGLGFQKEIGGNMLPNVDRYTIPFDDVLKRNASARIVYEFDAADMASTYMYPAMARSFRTAGIQLAAHFSYDPTFLAPYNTEYNTHFMNLIYAPRKALSLMICGEIFRTMPMYQDYGVYPDNSSFGPFRISYENDLAEMVTDEKFIYTNNTKTTPPNPDKLKLIAGWGNSPLVEYDGTGAYFLERISPGVWKLEVFPDALFIDNLFGRNSLQKRVAEVVGAAYKIRFHLPGIGSTFQITSLHPGSNQIIGTVYDDLLMTAGQYLLGDLDSTVIAQQTPDSLQNGWNLIDKSLKNTVILHKPLRQWSSTKDLTIEATIASPIRIDSVIFDYKPIYKNAKRGSVHMQAESGFKYTATIPASEIKDMPVDKLIPGNLFYEITAYSGKNITVFKTDRRVGEFSMASVTLDIVSEPDAIPLLTSVLDSSRINRTWIPGAKLLHPESGDPGGLYLKIEGLVNLDSENPNAPPVADYTLRHYFGDLIKGRTNDIAGKQTLYLDGYAVGKTGFPIQVALVMKDGSAFGGTIKLTPKNYAYKLLIADLKRINPVILPRPYPTFLPYYSVAGKAEQLDLNQIESLQISVGPGIKEEDWGKTYEMVITGVTLE